MAKKKSLKKVKLEVYEFKVTLGETSPVVWRKFLAHNIIELEELHMLIQMTMGWENSHLYFFQIDNKNYSPEISAKETNDIPLEGILLADVLGNSKKFNYIYDFGDDWFHEVEITAIHEHDERMQYPICIGGENACPPEDCGGPYGFENFKKALAGPDSEEKDELLSWVGGYYNPTTFDPNFVNKNFLWNEE